jgi:hypothetical protein
MGPRSQPAQYLARLLQAHQAEDALDEDGVAVVLVQE